MTADVRLLPCPFCSSPALVRRRGRRIWWFPSEGKVSCSNHSCGAYYSYWHPREWNTRTTASLNATIEMLRERVKELNAQLRAAYSAQSRKKDEP